MEKGASKSEDVGKVVSKAGVKNVKASEKFVMILAFVSIVGFVGIVSETLFDFDMKYYVEAFFMLIIGIGLVMEGQPSQLGRIKHEGLTPRNFANLITIIIGAIAIIAGLFSFPSIRIENSGFLAVKGIIAIIAIIIIVIQTWIIDND